MGKKITIEESEIGIITMQNDDYISLTDMAKSQMQDAIIIKWLSLKSTIEYLGNGKTFTIRILIIPNSVQLKILQVATVLYFL